MRPAPFFPRNNPLIMLTFRWRAHLGTAALWGALLLVACTAPDATPNRPSATQRDTLSGTFDLVVVGQFFDARASDIALRTNPSLGHEWTPLGPPSHRTNGGQILVWTDLSLRRYLGHDIRQNHLMLRMQAAPDREAELRAVYAVPHTREATDLAPRLRHLVRHHPQWVRRHSFASYVRPRPLALLPDTTFVTPVEAPVRHRKPGVLEVEWLELLYRSG